MSLTALPNDIIRLVAVYLPSNKDRLALAKTCKTIYHAIDGEHLYASLLNPAELVPRSLTRQWSLRTGHTAVDHVCAMGLVDNLTKLLQDPRVVPSWNDSQCFRIAAKRGQLAALHVLYKDGRVDVMSRQQEALRAAIECGHTDVVRYLLALPETKVGAIVQDASFVLAAPSLRGHIGVVRLLLEQSVVGVESNSYLALRWAIDGQQDSVVEYLLDFITEKEIGHEVPIPLLEDVLSALASSGKAALLSRVLAIPGFRSPAYAINEALVTAASHGFVDAMRVLVKDRRVDPSYQDNAALVAAAEAGHEQCVQLLLGLKSTDPAARNNSALRRACLKGHIKVVAALVYDTRIAPCRFECEAIRLANENPKSGVASVLESHCRVAKCPHHHKHQDGLRRMRGTHSCSLIITK